MLAATLLAAAVLTSFLALEVFRVEKREQLRARIERLSPIKSPRASVAASLGAGILERRLKRAIKEAGLEVSADGAALSLLFSFALLTGVFSLLGLPLFGPLAFLILLIGAFQGLKSLAKRRRRLLEEQLRFALYEMASSLRVVPNLASALEAAAESSEEPLAQELRRLTSEISGGASVEAALAAFAARLSLETARVWADSVTFAARAGADAAAACERAAKRIGERLAGRREVTSRAAGAKSQIVGISAIFAAFFAFMLTTSPEFLATLKSPLGKASLAYAALSYALGLFWAERVIGKELA